MRRTFITLISLLIFLNACSSNKNDRITLDPNLGYDMMRSLADSNDLIICKNKVSDKASFFYSLVTLDEAYKTDSINGSSITFYKDVYLKLGFYQETKSTTSSFLPIPSTILDIEIHESNESTIFKGFVNSKTDFVYIDREITGEDYSTVWTLDGFRLEEGAEIFKIEKSNGVYKNVSPINLPGYFSLIIDSPNNNLIENDFGERIECKE